MTRIGQASNRGLEDSRYVSVVGDTMTGALTLPASGLIMNAGTFNLTGGGTLALGGFTLTVPATGTATLGTGTTNYLAKWTGTNTVSIGLLYDDGTNIGVGVTSPTNSLSFLGTNTKKIWMERHTSANSAGNALTIEAGGATSGATDKAGGQLILSGGISTGTGISTIKFVTFAAATASTTTDNTTVQRMLIRGNNFTSIVLGPNSANTNARFEMNGNDTKGAPGLNNGWMSSEAATLTDNSTAASGTAANGCFNSFMQPTYAASNTGVTITDAANVYIQNAVVAGSNVTLTRPWALWVDAGACRFDGNLMIGGTTQAASLANGIQLVSGTAASGNITDGISMWEADRGGTAGKGALHLRTEDGTSHVFGDYFGIGTISPISNFHYTGSLTAYFERDDTTTYTSSITNSQQALYNADTTVNNIEGMQFVTDDSNATRISMGMIGIINTDHTASSCDGDLFVNLVAAGSLSQRLRLFSTGEFHIGGATSTPGQRFSMTGFASGGSAVLAFSTTTVGQTVGLEFNYNNKTGDNTGNMVRIAGSLRSGGGGDMLFQTAATNTTAYATVMLLSRAGNLCLGGTTLGTSAVAVYSATLGTAPSDSPADTVQWWESDRGGVAGKGALFLRAEDATTHVFGDLVGINNTAPATQFHVASSLTTSPRGIMSSQHNTGTDGARFHGRKSRGTIGSPTTIVTGDVLTKWVASGYDGSAYLEMANISMESEGTIGTNRIPTRIIFSTATNAATSVLTEAMRINSSQSVGIGDTTLTYLFNVGSGSLFGVTSAGLALHPLGSVGAPSMSFTGDTDTGLFSSAANTLNIVIGGNQLVKYSANTVTIGQGGGGTPTALTVAGAIASGTNIVGADITYDASNGTGTAGSGDHIFRGASPYVTASPTADANSTWAETGGLSSYTRSFTVTSRENQLLLVHVGVRSNTVSVSGITYNGVSLTKSLAHTHSGTTTLDNEVWYLVNPAIGANNLVITMSTAANIKWGAQTVYGVNQTTPLGTAVGNDGSGQTATSATVSSTATDVVFDFIMKDDNTETITPDVSQTQVYNAGSNPPSAKLGSSYKTAATSMVWTWTTTNRDWDIIAVPVKAASGYNNTQTERFRIKHTGEIVTPSTITAVGTTGNQTINKPAGRVNIAAAGTTVTVTNNLVTVNSIVLAVAATADATARVTNVVPSNGSFIINTVAVTAETAFNFLVIS